MTAANFGGKGRLPRKGRNVGGSRNVGAAAVGAVFPAVERTGEAAGADAAEREVGAHVGAAGGEDGGFFVRAAKADKRLAVRQVEAHGSALQAGEAGEVIPRGRRGGEGGCPRRAIL